jgi:hypothetical protein
MQKIMAEQALKKTQAEIEKLQAETLKTTVEADMADAQIGVITMPTVNQPGAQPAPGPVEQPSADAGMTGEPTEPPPPGI